MPMFIHINGQFINADRILRVEAISPVGKQAGYRIHFTNGVPTDFTDEQSVRVLHSYFMGNLINKSPLSTADFPDLAK